MKKEEIIKGNKLIAEYMAIKNDNGSLYNNIEGGYPACTLHFDPCLPVNYLLPEGHEHFDFFYGQWECNWSWLMPVVDKFMSIPPEEFNYDVQGMTQLRQCKEALNGISITANIKDVYNTLLANIIWYLEYKKPNTNS